MPSIYDSGSFDIKPDHVWWSINGEELAPTRLLKTGDHVNFQYEYRLPSVQPQDLRTETRRALVKLYESEGRKLAICLSGRDSEIIAVEAASLGIPFDLYSLQMWKMSPWIVETTQLVARDLGAKLNIVRLERSKCLDQLIFDSFEVMKIFSPTYLCLPELFKAIPNDETIVVGEGDLAKGDPFPIKNSRLAKQFTSRDQGVPINISEIVYRVWAQHHQRRGQYYFWSSTPELILAAYRHPKLIIDPPNIVTTQMIQDLWPRLRFWKKSFNWEGMLSTHAEIRKRLFDLKLQEVSFITSLVHV